MPTDQNNEPHDNDRSTVQEMQGGSSLRSQADRPGQDSPRYPSLPQAIHRQTPLPRHGVRRPCEHRTGRSLTNIGASNALLRQYFPKGTDLRVHSAEQLAAVAVELNERPRKTLGWDTPAGRLTALQVASDMQ